MKKRLNSTISIVLSLLCVLVITGIDIKIANQYLSSDGKTQALFGIVELASNSDKYWLIALSLGSIITSILGKRECEGNLIFSISLALGLISLILIFTPNWRLMV